MQPDAEAQARPPAEAYVWQFHYGGQIVPQLAQVMGNPVYFTFAPFLR